MRNFGIGYKARQ
uniref:Uncharacterized protein n=1 Tax=Rhizophora mucronata TaxID=61149 RepID=A0A2P2Q7A3_RHIMU